MTSTVPPTLAPESIPPRPAGGLSRPARAVILAWAIMTVADLGLVARYGQNVPLADDWYLVSRDHWSVTYWGWNTLHNEHRLPLPRGIIVELHRLTGMDFRAAMVLSVVLLALAAAVLARAAAGIRGRASGADAFFPLVLMSWAHAENLLMSWQVQFTLSVALASVALAAIATRSRRWFWPAGVCLLLLPLCGTNGLLFALPLSVALVLATRRMAAVVVAAGALAICGAYFLDFHPRPPSHRPAHDLSSLLGGLVECLGLPGLVGSLFALVGLCVAWRRDRALAVCILGFAALPLAVTWARADTGEISTRHALLLTPLWCATYLALLRTPTFVILLAYLAAAFALGSVVVGIAVGKAREAQLGPLRAAMQTGVAAERIVEDRLTGPLGWFEPADAPYLTRCIEELRARRHPCAG